MSEEELERIMKRHRSRVENGFLRELAPLVTLEALKILERAEVFDDTQLQAFVVERKMRQPTALFTPREARALVRRLERVQS